VQAGVHTTLCVVPPLLIEKGSDLVSYPINRAYGSLNCESFWKEKTDSLETMVDEGKRT